MAGPALRRALSLRDLIVYGLLFIGPLAPVGVFGVLDAQAGGAVALVYVLATVAMGFTAWSYAEMSRVVPHAGSVFAYATAGLGAPAGFLAGWLAMLDYLLIPSVAYLFSGIALHALVPSVPTWVFTSLAFAVTMVLFAVLVSVAKANPFHITFPQYYYMGVLSCLLIHYVLDGYLFTVSNRGAPSFDTVPYSVPGAAGPTPALVI